MRFSIYWPGFQPHIFTCTWRHPVWGLTASRQHAFYFISKVLRVKPDISPAYPSETCLLGSPWHSGRDTSRWLVHVHCRAESIFHDRAALASDSGRLRAVTRRKSNTGLEANTSDPVPSYRPPLGLQPLPVPLGAVWDAPPPRWAQWRRLGTPGVIWGCFSRGTQCAAWWVTVQLRQAESLRGTGRDLWLCPGRCGCQPTPALEGDQTLAAMSLQGLGGFPWITPLLLISTVCRIWWFPGPWLQKMDGGKPHVKDDTQDRRMNLGQCVYSEPAPGKPESCSCYCILDVNSYKFHKNQWLGREDL